MYVGIGNEPSWLVEYTHCVCVMYVGVGNEPSWLVEYTHCDEVSLVPCVPGGIKGMCVCDVCRRWQWTVVTRGVHTLWLMYWRCKVNMRRDSASWTAPSTTGRSAAHVCQSLSAECESRDTCMSVTVGWVWVTWHVYVSHCRLSVSHMTHVCQSLSAECESRDTCMSVTVGWVWVTWHINAELHETSCSVRSDVCLHSSAVIFAAVTAVSVVWHCWASAERRRATSDFYILYTVSM